MQHAPYTILISCMEMVVIGSPVDESPTIKFVAATTTALELTMCDAM